MPPLDGGWVDRYQVHRSLPGYPQVSPNATPARQQAGITPNPTTPYRAGSDGYFTNYAVGNNQYDPDYQMETYHRGGNNMFQDILEDRISLLLAIIVALLFLNVLLLFFLFIHK